MRQLAGTRRVTGTLQHGHVIRLDEVQSSI